MCVCVFILVTARKPHTGDRSNFGIIECLKFEFVMHPSCSADINLQARFSTFSLAPSFISVSYFSSREVKRSLSFISLRNKVFFKWQGKFINSIGRKF